MNKTLEKKKQQLEKLRIEVADLEFDDQMKVEYPKALFLKGTYWKFRNSYSCPETEADHWWLYEYIFDVTPDGQIHCNNFQIDKYGKLTVDVGQQSSWKFRDSWVPSSKKEWTKALNDAKSIMNKLMV